MKMKNFIIIFVTAIVLMIPLCFGETSDEYLKRQAYPYILEQSKMVETLVADAAKPTHVLRSIYQAEVIETRPLMFEAQVDERPYVFEQCIMWAKTKLNNRSEWWLVEFYRSPYGPLLGHQKWEMSFIGGIHSPNAFRQYDHAPTNKDMDEFLGWAGWNFSPRKDFKFITTRIFNDNWKYVFGAESTKKYAE